MNPQMNWKYVKPQVALAIIISAVAGIVLLPQVVAVTLLAPESVKGENKIRLFDLVRLWVTRDPSTITSSAFPGWVHWVTIATFFVLVGGIIVLLVWHVHRERKNPQNKKGLATVREAQKELGVKQLLLAGKRFRMATIKGTALPKEAGYLVGEFKGIKVWVKIEDPMIIIGPSRSGKGWYIILNWIVDAPGPVIATSSKIDNARITMGIRQKKMGSTAWMFSPGDEDGKKLGKTLRWDPIDGCINEAVLLRRVKSFIPAGAFGGSTNSGHWDTLGQQLAAALFHAAACAGGSVEMIWKWVMNPSSAVHAVSAIRNHADGLLIHADFLEGVLNEPPEQRASSWGVLTTTLAFMDSASAREWLTIPDGEENFSPKSFIFGNETIYMVGDKEVSRPYLRIIDALLAEIDFVAKDIAKKMPAQRLDPPLTYLLDEAGNFEYAGLKELITAGGSVGRVGVAVFQSKEQLKEYGDTAQGTLWDAAKVKIILPGGASSAELQDMEKLIGEVWVERQSQSFNDQGISISSSEQKESIFTASEIREMEKGYCLLFYGNAKPIIAKMYPFSEHPDYKEALANDKQAFEYMLESSASKDEIEQHLAKYR